MSQTQEAFAGRPKLTQRASAIKVPLCLGGFRKFATLSLGLALSAAVFFELFVIGSLIYRMNPDVQQLAATQQRAQIVRRRHLESVKTRYQTVVVAVQEVAHPDARIEFLEQALAEARCELEGHQAYVDDWKDVHQRLNTPFRRLAGNETLNCVARELDHGHVVMGVSRRHVDQIAAMLQAQFVRDQTPSISQLPIQKPEDRLVAK